MSKGSKLKTIDDFADLKASELAKTDFRNIVEITELYSKFLEMGPQGGYLSVSVHGSSAPSSESQKLRKQFIAAAIVNYELGSRDCFEMPSENGSYLFLERAHPAEVYKRAGDDCLRLASQI